MSKKVSQVWIVWGSTGEYEDVSEWIVDIFDAEVKAKQCLDEMRQKFDELGLHEDGNKTRCDDYEYRWEISENTGIYVDYTGVSFSMSGPHEVK